MRAYTFTELMSLTRADLFAAHQQIVDALAQLPEGFPARLTALATLRDIRRCWLERIHHREPRRPAT